MKKDDLFHVQDNLTINGVTQSIILQVTFGGTIEDPYGNTKAGFEIEGKINRQEFGLHWSAVTEAGWVVVGDEIKIQGHFELIK
jgi:polyisoprenoid-binding protein YceI